MNAPKPNRVLTQLRAAASLWEQIRDAVQPADRLIANFFHQHRSLYGSRDRRFLSETTYALFRHKSRLELWKNYLELSRAEGLAALAAFSESLITREDFESATGKAAPEPAALGGLPPGHPALEGPAYWAARYSFPEWLAEKWLRQFGEAEAQALLEASLMRPPLNIRTNTLKISRDALLGSFRSRNLEVERTALSPVGLVFRHRANVFESPEFHEGYFEVQDEGSQLVTLRVDPQPGESIWDVCAGGGGKSLMMAALMKNKGRIVATDIRAWKLEELRKRASRAGIHTIFPADLNRMKEMQAARKGFDRILVDAPCSGTGTLRRNPDAKWKLKPETFAVNARDQLDILRRAIPYLKPGGWLYYVTCSLEPEENEEVIDRLLTEEHSLVPESSVENTAGRLRLSPAREGTDGFFLAILRKKT